MHEATSQSQWIEMCEHRNCASGAPPQAKSAFEPNDRFGTDNEWRVWRKLFFRDQRFSDHHTPFRGRKAYWNNFDQEFLFPPGISHFPGLLLYVNRVCRAYLVRVFTYPPDFLGYAAYIHPVHPNFGEIYTAHAWSLSVEENFYFLWPAAFKVKPKQRKNITLFFIFLVPLVRIFLYIHPVHWIGEDSIFTRIDSIAMGCYVALCRNELVAGFSAHWDKFFFGSLGILFIFPWLNFWAIKYGFGFFTVAFGLLDGLVANVCIVIILFYSVYGPRNGWFKVLNSRVFNFIGILSYSIYLWQQLFLMPSRWWVAQFPQNLVFIFLAALFSRYIVEKPFLELKSRFSPRRAMHIPKQAVNKESQL